MTLLLNADVAALAISVKTVSCRRCCRCRSSVAAVAAAVDVIEAIAVVDAGMVAKADGDGAAAGAILLPMHAALSLCRS
jgi:hypothetical protein